MTPDHINAAFELTAAVILWANVRRLWRDRELKGVSVLPTCLYALWCVWNMYYYAHLGQWLSWWAGIGVGVANVAWVALALWFRPVECRDPFYCVERNGKKVHTTDCKRRRGL